MIVVRSRACLIACVWLQSVLWDVEYQRTRTVQWPWRVAIGTGWRQKAWHLCYWVSKPPSLHKSWRLIWPLERHHVSNCNCNCNCNWGTCILPPTRGPTVHHRVNPYPGARKQNQTEMFSDHDETSLSIAAVSGSAPSVCSMLAVQQQKRLCRQFVDVSAAWRGCHTMKHVIPVSPRQF